MPVATAAVARGFRRKKKGGDAADGETHAHHHREHSRFNHIAIALKQPQVRAAYMNHTVQWSIAGLIMGNFMTNVVEKQIDPWNTKYPDHWPVIEAVWNYIFILELVWNIYGCWYISTLKGHFLCSGWNLFDALVVGVSIPSLTGADLGSFSQMRMLRAFRVFRLFKRIKSLNKILVSLGKAVPGILNAALVQLIVMCIFAILGVDLFGNLGDDGYYINVDNQSISMVSMRGMTYGDEYYGTFLRSLYTLFQVLTGESWSEVVARPIVFSEGINGYIGAVYFVIYIIVCGIVLVNVVVAVLLEKMVDNEPHDTGDIVLASLPPMAKEILTPLDTDGDGVLTRTELKRAAELLKKEEAREMLHIQSGEEQAKEISRYLVESMRDSGAEAMLPLGGKAVGKEISNVDDHITRLAEESAKREGRMEEQLAASAAREEALQRQLASLTQSMAELSALAMRPRRKAAAAKAAAASGTGARRRPVAPAAGAGDVNGGDLAPYTASAGGAGATAQALSAVALSAGVGAAVAEGAEEDRVQDGEREPSKQAPERLRQCC